MSGYNLREASVADAPVLARQRAAMFVAMGTADASSAAAIAAATQRYVEEAMPAGTFRAWVVEADGAIVAGGGIQIRPLVPRPGAVDGEPEGLVVSMWTDEAHRRRGLARLVLNALTAAGRAAGCARLVLHASDDGRPLYAEYGFSASNEMRLQL